MDNKNESLVATEEQERLTPTEVTKSQPYRHLKHRYDGLVAHCTEQEQKLNKQATQLRRLNYGNYHSLDVWFWMPDEDNGLDTITCPIVIQPGDLKALKDKITRYEMFIIGIDNGYDGSFVEFEFDIKKAQAVDNEGEQLDSTTLKGPATDDPDFDAYKRFVEETGNAASFEQFKGVLDYHRSMDPERWTIPAPPKSPVEPPLSRIEPAREPISDPRLKNTSVANRIMKRWKTIIEKQ